MAAKKLFIFALILLNITLYGQQEIDSLNLNLIPYKKVRNYILEIKNQNICLFSELKPSWKSDCSNTGYHIQEKTYFVKDNLSKVWDKYRTTSPAEAWHGKKVMFGFMFSKKNNEPVFAGDDFAEIDTGQVIFLNLKLLKFYNLAMAFEIISVNTENKTIEFSYIDGNVSSGKQSLQFLTTDDGYTQIIHSSFFASDSKLRDKVLYPFFHTRTTNEFHRIMRKIISQDSGSSSELAQLK